ncbi:hypothetical protein E5226_14480 [Cellulomonas shaoxiangyii]|jgi:hypothetical protein|nr:hypothetical protein [Cellulomonas shaoxiangyii]TGY81261.1 hypothetical protein E5226_14480 [Cellulomonas shaoxiangyii]
MNNKYLSLASTFLPGVSGGLSTHSAPLASFDKANVNSQRVATKLIANFFSKPLATDVQALASKPVFSVSGDKVVINVFYYLASEKALNNGSINSLGQVLSKLFKQPVELRFVRLHYPYLDSYILAQYIAINTSKYNFTRIQRAIFGALQFPVLKASELEDTTLPSYITGMKIRISGRLTTQRSVPRQTVQTAQVGSFSSSHIPSNKSGIISSASFSTKNQKGAFTVKVWISQVAHTS